MGPGRLFWQVFSHPPLPTATFADKTVIVTGANVGLGKEAVKHFVRLGAKVIGTARSNSKAATALADINAETKGPGRAMIWELEYGSYASVLGFCERALSELDRLDVVILNAGAATRTYELLEGEESSITINVISTLLLALSLLPKLRQTAATYNVSPCLTVTSSKIHSWAKFPEREAAYIFAALNDPLSPMMQERYPTSKLLQLLAIRELASRTSSTSPQVVINLVSPGLNRTSLTRETTGLEAIVLAAIHYIFAWDPEVGSRILVHATMAGKKSHGVLLDRCEIENDILAPWIETDEGRIIQRKVWSELEKKLEAIRPGILSGI
ncbi:short-chain dehydrogenase/reductase [Histoplasma capsulatum var. duboisii H88]|uniref:Short-chain dehydrogenase/reductase n=1 Tax=Ajellomyces capsulatus (strain H88) TaxID=544711 RepID=F0UMY3_AJEC8|nr:short-chain dehydrogenase/reductase [Histoplasma capsulatum var. duboisii H88]QSS53627.1 short-chain dehydrogenase/reductase [Histoplasma capsulatum var. duboisii H88]